MPTLPPSYYNVIPCLPYLYHPLFTVSISSRLTFICIIPSLPYIYHPLLNISIVPSLPYLYHLPLTIYIIPSLPYLYYPLLTISISSPPYHIYIISSLYLYWWIFPRVRGLWNARQFFPRLRFFFFFFKWRLACAH